MSGLWTLKKKSGAEIWEIQVGRQIPKRMQLRGAASKYISRPMQGNTDRRMERQNKRTCCIGRVDERVNRNPNPEHLCQDVMGGGARVGRRERGTTAVVGVTTSSHLR